MAGDEEDVEQIKVTGNEKKDSGSLLTKILTIVFFISLFVLLLAGTATVSILMRNFMDRTLNVGTGAGGTGGSMDSNCSELTGSAKQYIELVNAAAQKYGVDPALVAAIVEQESSWNPNAYRYEPSINDASYGLMQTLYGTAKGLGYSGAAEGLYDPATSLEYGTKYISQHLKEFKDTKLALAAYNGGGGAISNGKIIVPQAESYANSVLKLYEKYKKCLSNGQLGTSEAGTISSYGYIWPTAAKGTITSNFGPRWGTNHNGVDIGVDVGTIVRATKSGTVTTAQDLSPNGAGNAVIIDHGDGTETEYFHLSQIGVTAGQQVQQGQTIGLSGGAKGAQGSGSSEGPHLHFQININGTPVDPMLYLPQ